MAAKPQHAEPPPAAAAAAEAAVKPAANAMGGLLPLIVVIVLAPTLSWAVGQFVLLPQLKKQLAVASEAGHAEGGEESAHAAPEKKGEGGKEEGHGKKGESSGPATNYEFENIVVNLAGTMGTRYLKTSFMVSGKESSLRSQFENNRAKLVDVTLNVLSSLSLSDLEEAGAKNLIREKLIAAYNQALGKKVVDQVYFSDFVVQ
jgi:flagellar FliL protein